MHIDHNHHLNAFLMAIALAFAVLGCDSENTDPLGPEQDEDESESPAGETYDVVLEWQIEGDYECVGLLKGQPVPFDKITIDLYQEDDAGSRTDVQYFDDLDCTLFEYTLPRLPAGDYLFTVSAWATYEAEQLPFYEAQGSFTLDSEAIEPLETSLSKGKGSLEIQWGFDNFLQCRTNHIDEITILITDEGLEQQFETITQPCDNGSYVATDLRWSTYTVHVEGFGAEAETAEWSGAHGVEPIEVRPGQHLPIPVIMGPVE